MKPSAALAALMYYSFNFTPLAVAYPNRIKQQRQVTQSSAPTPVAGGDTGGRANWQQAAKIEPARDECSPYYFEPVGSIVNTYPPIWQTADLQSSGISAEDIAFFNSINGSIPKIAPRGTRAGDFSGVVYNGVLDSDCWWSFTTCTTPKITSIPPDITRCNEPLSYGLSIDDGPNCSHNAYYDYLRTKKQKATLYYIGSNVLDWPLEAQRGLGDGHDICAHTWSHPYMTAMTNEQAFAELYYAKKAIYDVLGITVQCWRPPYGDVDDRIRWIAQKLGMVTMLWSADTSDWKVATIGMAAVEANYNNIVQAGRNGTYSKQGVMVLSHELNNQTMAISRMFLPQIQEVFTGGVMPMAVCMNNSEPYAEKGGKYVYPNIKEWKAGTRSITLLQPTAASRILNIIPSSLTSAIKPESTNAVSAAGMVASGFPITKVITTTASSTAIAAAADHTSSSTTSSGARNGFAYLSTVLIMVVGCCIV